MKQRFTSVDEAIKKSAEKKTEADRRLHVDETIQKAWLILNKQAVAVEKVTGVYPDRLEMDPLFVNGHKVQFGLLHDDPHVKIYVRIDGKEYAGQAMREQILKVDGIGLTGKEAIKHTYEKKKSETLATIRRDMPVYRRTLAISAMRGAAAAGRQAEYNGDTIIAKLLAIIGRTFSQPQR